MFDLEREGKNAVQEVKVCFGDLLGKQKEEVWVKIAEPDTFDCLKIKSVPKDEANQAEFVIGYFKEIFPKYLVDHSFTEGDNKASTDAVARFVFRKMPIADYVTGEYFKAVFLTPQSKTKEK